MPAVPQKPAGLRIEPPVSEPIAPMQSCAATAAPEPLDEPPGWYAVFHGLRAAGKGWSGVIAPCADSCEPRLPRMTAPAPCRRRTVSASIAGTYSFLRFEWPVVSTPAVS